MNLYYISEKTNALYTGVLRHGFNHKYCPALSSLIIDWMRILFPPCCTALCCTAHYVVLQTMLYCKLCCTAHYVVLQTMLYYAIYCTAYLHNRFHLDAGQKGVLPVLDKAGEEGGGGLLLLLVEGVVAVQAR